MTITINSRKGRCSNPRCVFSVGVMLLLFGQAIGMGAFSDEYDSSDSHGFVLDTRRADEGQWVWVAGPPSGNTGVIDSTTFALDTRSIISATSSDFRVDTRGLGAGTTVSGIISAQDGGGQLVGGLAGATIEVVGYGRFVADSQGRFEIPGIPAGSYDVTFSQAGFNPITRTIELGGSRGIGEILSLTPMNLDGPQIYGHFCEQGSHFFEGFPGNINLSTEIQWNGPVGTTEFLIGDAGYAPEVDFLGDGRARASMQVAIPSNIDQTCEWKIRVTNGEGESTTANTGVFFYPTPPSIPAFLLLDDPLAWVTLADKYLISITFQFDLWKLESQVGLSTSADFFGTSTVEFYPRTGEYRAGRANGGSFNIEAEVDGIEALGSGGVSVDAVVNGAVRGTVPPTIEGSLGLNFFGKAGIGVPLAKLGELIPVAGQVIAAIRKIPGVSEVVDVTKIRIFQTPGGGIRGFWGNDESACWLGASSYEVSGFKVGLELQALTEINDMFSVGFYGGASGTPSLQVCPEIQFQGITLAGYLGCFANAYMFTFQEEIGWETTLGGADKSSVRLAASSLEPIEAKWVPTSDLLLRWGAMNRRPTRPRSISGTTPSELCLVENVTNLSTPSLLSDEEGIGVLFMRHDPEKPWYAATDVYIVRPSSAGAFDIEPITDDLKAEFQPRGWTEQQMGSGRGIAWTRVEGDVSEAEGPEEIAQHLEIIAMFGSEAPVRITNNTILDRDPSPLSIGDERGVLFIRNDGQLELGSSDHGDQLLFASSQRLADPPSVLWEGDKGIPDYTFAVDSAGDVHVVFVVDEDGDPASAVDRELYYCRSAGGLWNGAVRLTSDDIADEIPAICIPDGRPICVWKRDGRLNYSAMDSWTAREVYPSDSAVAETASLACQTLPGGAVIVFSVPNNGGSDLASTFYHSALDRWSQPVVLTHDEHAETGVSLAREGDALVLAYLKTQTIRENVLVELDGEEILVEESPLPGRTDLYYLRKVLAHDPALVGLQILGDEVAPGAQVTLRALVYNQGELPADGLQVTFFQNDPMTGGPMLGSVAPQGILMPGESQAVDFDWILPDSGHVQNLFASVAFVGESESQDRDYTNNMASILTLLPNLSLVSAGGESVGPDLVALHAKIMNTGVVSSGGSEVVWRLDNQAQTEIGRKVISGLAPGESSEIVLLGGISDSMLDSYGRVRIRVAIEEIEMEQVFEDNVFVHSVSMQEPTSKGSTLWTVW